MSEAVKTILEIDRVHRAFGGILALNDVGFQVSQGEIKAIIGPNGAGKTTLFNVISGVIPATSGRIVFEGRTIEHLKPHVIASLGISRTFQTSLVFNNMSVLENVMVGRHPRSRRGMLHVSFKTPQARREEWEIAEKAKEKLAFVGIHDSLDSPPGSLPFALHKRVEVARALATEPKLLFLDEPAAGLNIRETEEMANLIRKIRDIGITILLVEHDMSLVMDISDEVIVLERGAKIAEGPPREIQRNKQVIDVYLGESEEQSASDR